MTTAPSTEGSIVAPEEPTQPAVTQEPTDTQSETQAQITADGTETTPTAQTQAPEIADTGDSLVVGGAVLASLAACGLLIVTRKRNKAFRKRSQNRARFKTLIAETRHEKTRFRACEAKKLLA